MAIWMSFKLEIVAFFNVIISTIYNEDYRVIYIIFKQLYG